MLVHILASGSEGNSVYIQTKNKKVLIDTGMNYKYLKERLEEIDVDPSEIDSILITHTHSDHTSALKVFLNKHNPEVYVDEEMLNEIPFLKEYTNLVLDFKDYKFEDTIIEMFHTSHDAPASRGYIIKENDESFVYITDTGYINQRLFKKLYNHTKYVFERTPFKCSSWILFI